jgi:hypothetical protein
MRPSNQSVADRQYTGFWAKAEQGSGTAAVSAAMADLQKPLSGLAPKALAAVLTSNPRFNRWMMRGGGPRTGAAAGTTVPLSVLVGLTARKSEDQ